MDKLIELEIKLELARQFVKWGEQNHPNGTGKDVKFLGQVNLPTWGTICERAHFKCDYNAEDHKETFLDILLEEVAEAFCEANPKNLRAELIQVIAVCVTWIESIDRRIVDDKETLQS
ncbi:MAG: hypothetical protein ACREHG_10125 [Candidatus Saccharimonadales bacterium]